MKLVNGALLVMASISLHAMTKDDPWTLAAPMDSPIVLQGSDGNLCAPRWLGVACSTLCPLVEAWDEEELGTIFVPFSVATLRLLVDNQEPIKELVQLAAYSKNLAEEYEYIHHSGQAWTRGTISRERWKELDICFKGKLASAQASLSLWHAKKQELFFTADKKCAPAITHLVNAYAKLPADVVVEFINLIDFLGLTVLKELSYQLVALLDEQTRELLNPAIPSDATLEAYFLWAAKHALLDVMKSLRETYQVAIDCTNEHGQTALHIAAEKGYEEVVSYLIEQRADQQIGQLYNNRLPIHLAVCSGHLGCYRLLHNPPYARADSAGNTMVHLAAMSNNGTLLSEIVSSVPFRNCFTAQNSCGDTPLHCAVDYGAGETVTLILERANILEPRIVHFANGVGRTALMVACERGFEHLVQQLVEAGSSLKEADSNGDTPLALACRRGSVPCVRYLSRCDGIELGARNGKGETPLLIAATWGNVKLFRFLMEEAGRGIEDLGEVAIATLRNKRVKNYLKSHKPAREKDAY